MFFSPFKNILKIFCVCWVQGSKIRSGAEWLDKGEKPSSFYLQLEKSNYINKTIKELVLEDDTSIINQQDILVHVRQYYADLYEEKKGQLVYLMQCPV